MAKEEIKFPKLTEQNSFTQSRLQAISIVDDNHLWVSGLDGTVLHTKDGGVNWMQSVVVDSKKLQFRDIYALDNKNIWLLSAGTGEESRIYYTDDGGINWNIQITNQEPIGFYNCMQFWDKDNGMVYGDSINGELFVLKTTNGGKDWLRISADKLPQAMGSEGGFAASGTCLKLRGKNDVWIGTGAGEKARVLISNDRGESWRVKDTPIVNGKSAGITSVVFMENNQAIVLGGDLERNDQKLNNVAISLDNGKSFQLATSPSFTGGIYGGAYAFDKTDNTLTQRLLVVSPKGLDYSATKANSWTSISTNDYWSVAFSSTNIAWAVGPNGRITKIEF